MYVPSDKSHKGDNGQLLIVGGSKKFHGAPLLAAHMASKIVDLVFFCSTLDNNRLLQKMKKDLAEFIAVPRREVNKHVERADVVLIGPGLDVGAGSKRLVNGLLKKFPQKKFVLDADALKVVDLKLLNANCVVTPHKNEFRTMFKKIPTEQNVQAMAKKYKCVIVLKGKEDIVCSPRKCKINKIGNAGMTKGGTGDVLAGLISALACKNDLFLSACKGVYLNGKAGDCLFKKVSYYYNASDLIATIPKLMRRQ